VRPVVSAMKNLESNPLIAQCFNKLRLPALNTANSANMKSELRVIPGKGTGIFITFFFRVYDATSLGYAFRRQFVASKLRQLINQRSIIYHKEFPEHTSVRTSYRHTAVAETQGINSDQNELFAAGLQMGIKSYCLNMHDRLLTLRTKGLRNVIRYKQNQRRKGTCLWSLGSSC
jgi:hypothetical protein